MNRQVIDAILTSADRTEPAAYVIGLDFGTLSVRALLMEARSGREVAQAVCPYPHGVISESFGGSRLPEGYALQDPSDYIYALGEVVRSVLQISGIEASQVKGMGVDFTCCTLLPVGEDGLPLSFHEEFANRPHAYVKLWKHHAAVPDADRLHQCLSERGQWLLNRYGGKISCEWALPKMMEVFREDIVVFNSAKRFAEAGDWVISMITGEVCVSESIAGYKACYDSQTGFPTDDFLAEMTGLPPGTVVRKLTGAVCAPGTVAGRIHGFGAQCTGLPEGVPVAAAMPDAHAAMPAMGVWGPNTMALILGTSACHLLHTEQDVFVPGTCGSVYGGVVPGLYSHEAGQSGCGDILDAFLCNAVPGEYERRAAQSNVSLHTLLIGEAEKMAPGECGLLALDWFNGNRSVLNDGNLSGLILGMTLQTKPEHIYRALLEAIAFGTRTIVENYRHSGVNVDAVVVGGGMAYKNTLMVQIMADVLRLPVRICGSEQASARGSALYGAVCAGVYPDIVTAAQKCAVEPRKTVYPNPAHAAVYDALFAQYSILHQWFAKENPVMYQLRAYSKNCLACEGAKTGKQ